ncbi:MAG: HAD family phosphatase [Coriobacteriales bacterium]|jgi:HAD superfamily hydrolase (TIGR01509 family)|nr:HAD family phosphatase [Coriobacteriales bacterium]
MELSGAIFDLDGTLLDSMSCWDSIASDYLRSRGIEAEPGLDHRINAMSLPQAARYLHEHYLPEVSPEHIQNDTNAHITRAYRDTLEFKPGARALLDELKQCNVPLCLVTATDLPHVEALFTRLNAHHYFKELFTCTEFGSHKDEPAIFEAALAALGSQRETTPVFEDALYALRTAHAAGFPTVAVYDTANDEDWDEVLSIVNATIKAPDYLTVLSRL